MGAAQRDRNKIILGCAAAMVAIFWLGSAVGVFHFNFSFGENDTLETQSGLELLLDSTLKNPPTSTDVALRYAASPKLLEANQHLVTEWISKVLVHFTRPSDTPLVFPTDFFAYTQVTLKAPLKRYGGGGDGGKLLTAVESLKAPCIVYSLGSNNNFQFEEAMLKATPCVVHTFDCTADGTGHPTDTRFHYHPWCVGGGPPGGLSYPITTIVERLGHHPQDISIFKMDIEGSEWSVFPDMFRAGFLPQQISFELHVREERFFQRWTARLFLLTHTLGYRVVNKEVNPLCAKCCEYTLLRVQPSSPLGGGSGMARPVLLPPQTKEEAATAAAAASPAGATTR